MKLFSTPVPRLWTGKCYLGTARDSQNTLNGSSSWSLFLDSSHKQKNPEQKSEVLINSINF
jgi:hypothetical protein